MSDPLTTANPLQWALFLLGMVTSITLTMFFVTYVCTLLGRRFSASIRNRILNAFYPIAIYRQARWAGSIIGYEFTTTGRRLSARNVLLVAATLEEATGKAHAMAKENWPTEEGWSTTVAIGRVNDDWDWRRFYAEEIKTV